MAQRYASPISHHRMADNRCPECGQDAEAHSGDPRFWMHFGNCDLVPEGVTARIAQYHADLAANEPCS